MIEQAQSFPWYKIANSVENSCISSKLDVDFEEDMSSDSDSKCLETPSLEESLEEEEEDESEQGQQKIMVEVECPALPISAVTEADIVKTATQDQEPSVIAFNPRGRPKKMVTKLN